MSDTPPGLNGPAGSAVADGVPGGSSGAAVPQGPMGAAGAGAEAVPVGSSGAAVPQGPMGAARAGRFETAVRGVLDGLGPGEVVTYGEVALEAGFPGAARAVGRLLATSGGRHPWWRVVDATGRLVPGHEDEQARRLGGEGVDVADGRVRWPPAAPRGRRARTPRGGHR